MSPLDQFAVVRVRQLLRPPETHGGWNVNRRPPQVGDVGTVVDVLRAPGVAENYVVECVRADGTTEWLGDFSRDELEVVAPDPVPLRRAEEE